MHSSLPGRRLHRVEAVRGIDCDNKLVRRRRVQWHGRRVSRRKVRRWEIALISPQATRKGSSRDRRRSESSTLEWIGRGRGRTSRTEGVAEGEDDSASVSKALYNIYVHPWRICVSCDISIVNRRIGAMSDLADDIALLPLPKQQLRLPLRQIKDRLREHAVGPRKPAARVILDPVDVDALMHQA